MVLKRHCDQERDRGSEIPIRNSRQRITFARIVRDVMRVQSVHELVKTLEPFCRSWVREEVERAFVLFHHSSPSSSLYQFGSSQTRACQLHFDEKLPSSLFTGGKIESENGKPVKIVLLDAVSKEILSSGPLSSTKIEILVLDGEFGADDREDWTEEEFNVHIVREREGKRPLVTGGLVINLIDGVGYIGDISFTDNSSWIRSRRFRLGARAVNTELKIREARSEPFVVKDHRGESYRKHYPPNLGDEIWRLEKIAKDGAFHRRLASKEINTVKDFLQHYYFDPSSLRTVLGGGLSNKTWETIIEHATACVLDDKFYICYADKVVLLFNSVFKVVGASFDGKSYNSLDNLNVFQMGLVETAKRHAYKNLDAWVPFNELSASTPAMLQTSQLADRSYTSISSGLEQVNFPGVHHDQMHLASGHMATTPSYTFNVRDDSHPMQFFASTSTNSFMATDSYSGLGSERNSWASSGSVGAGMQLGHPSLDDNSQVQSSTWQGNGFFLAPSNEALQTVPPNFDIHISKKGKSKARWCIIRAVIKCGISLRRHVAAKNWHSFFT